MQALHRCTQSVRKIDYAQVEHLAHPLHRAKVQQKGFDQMSYADQRVKAERIVLQSMNEGSLSLLLFPLFRWIYSWRVCCC